MAFSVQEFASNLNRRNGLAKSALFEVFITLPTYVSDYASGIIKSKTEPQKPSAPAVTQSVSTPPNTSDKVPLLSQNTVTSGTKYGVPSYSDPVLMETSPLIWQCEATELPGRNITLAETRIYGLNYKMPYQTTYNDISLTFICTNLFYERKLFEKWLEEIIPTDTYNVKFMVGEDGLTYASRIDIYQYDPAGTLIYAVALNDAYPIAINAQNVNWSDDGYHRLTVQFTYKNYSIIK